MRWTDILLRLRALLFRRGWMKNFRRRCNPATIAAVSLVLLLSALLACYIPATQVDPMVALRTE